VTPYYADDWLTVYHGDTRAVMAEMEPDSVNCVVTSPPYWGLRDYGEPGQLGLEPTPEAYVAAMVDVFREVRRVLRSDGTVWLNLGSSYMASADRQTGRNDDGRPEKGRGWAEYDIKRTRPDGVGAYPTFKPKDLVGIPWMVAFALQADGWYLRSDIIWHKPNPMPESCQDRPTKSHEYVFLLSKSARYYYDAAAIAESATSFGRQHTTGIQPPKVIALQQNGHAHNGVGGDLSINYERQSRNKRSVWTIPTLAYAGAHYATMPEALIRPCILAGCPLGGLVLDPFLGSGTVGAVAERLGRRWVGCDLTYHALSTQRTAQRGLFVTAADHPEPEVFACPK
jgi:DNA modification methylase